MYNIFIYIYIIYRRKFRNQTSDNMDRWKAEMGRVREEKRRRKRKSQKKEDPGRRKGRKVAKHYVFPMIWGSGGSKSRLAKAAGAEPAGQMRDEKLHAVVARSTFPSQNVQNTAGSEHFWKLRCRKRSKKCTPLWRDRSCDVEKVHAVVARSTFASEKVKKMLKTPHVRSTFGSWDVEKVHAVVWHEAHFEVKMYKTHQVQSTFGSCDVAKCTPLWREAHVEVKSAKTRGFGALFDVQMPFRVAGARDCQKWAKREGFCSISKNNGRRGTFEEDVLRCIFRGRRSTRDMFIRAVRRSGCWFPERGCRGCNLEPQIFRFAEMILRDRCSTSYDLTSLFRGKRSSLDRWTGKIAKRIGTR